MQRLAIPVNHKAAKGNAWFLAGLTTLLASGSGYIIFSGSIADEGWFGTLLGLGLCTWLFGFLIAWVLRLFRLSAFEGPLLTITETGIIDHWQKEARSLAWNEIEYSV